MLRPFAAVVLPGCDARLGAWPVPEGLLPREAAALAGIASPEERQRRERLAFAQLLRVAPLTLLRRARDGAESLAPSRLVEQLRLSLSTQGLALRAVDRSADHDRGAAGTGAPRRGDRARARSRPPLGDGARDPARLPLPLLRPRDAAPERRRRDRGRARQARLGQLAARGAAAFPRRPRARPRTGRRCRRLARRRARRSRRARPRCRRLPALAGQLRRLRAALPRVHAPARPGRGALAARRAVVHAALARGRGGAVRHRRPHRRGRRRRRRRSSS